MLIEYVRYWIPADRADQFVAAYAPAGAVLRNSSHCLGHALAHYLGRPHAPGADFVTA